MEQENFDVELFIDQIEKRPSIWDMSSPDYSNRILKRNAWEELVLIYSNGGDSEEKKKTLGLSLQRKWKGLRDTFVRELKKMKNSPSGSGAWKSKYLYFQRLMFLECSVSNKPTDSNIASPNAVFEDRNNADDIMKPPSVNRKRKCLSGADAEFLNIIKQQIAPQTNYQSHISSNIEQDDDKLFCLSLHKELLKVPEANRIGVKIQLMSCVQKAQQQNQFQNHSMSWRLQFSSQPSYQQLESTRRTTPEYDPTHPSITPI